MLCEACRRTLLTDTMIDEDNTDKGYYINGTFLACSPLDVADQTKSLVTLTDTVTSYK